MLDQMKAALDSAQSELILADIALMEATARQNEASEATFRLQSAVAALSGEKAPAEPSSTALPSVPALQTEVVTVTEPGQAKSIHDMTQEEFEASRVAKKAKEKADERKWREENDPLFHVPCSGCGQTGVLQQTVMTAPSGAQVSLKVCGSCGNQMMG